MSNPRTAQATKAKAFASLHASEDLFVMPNAWNAGSARLLEEAGFAAVGTTSAGFAYASALPDAAGRLPLARAMVMTEEIAAAIALPVNADAENGYGHEAGEVAGCIRQCAAAGCVGAGIEDYSGDPARGLYELEHAVERIAAARQAADALDFPFVLTARADCYLYGLEDAFAVAVERLNRFREAGADCLYAPGLADTDTIARLVREVDGPVNVVIGQRNAHLTVDELRQCGVRRISIGGTLARAAFRLVELAATEMREQGTFDFAAEQLGDAYFRQLFA